jgi:hypothetical protein
MRLYHTPVGRQDRRELWPLRRVRAVYAAGEDAPCLQVPPLASPQTRRIGRDDGGERSTLRYRTVPKSEGEKPLSVKRAIRSRRRTLDGSNFSCLTSQKSSKSFSQRSRNNQGSSPQHQRCWNLSVSIVSKLCRITCRKPERSSITSYSGSVSMNSMTRVNCRHLPQRLRLALS